MCTILTSETQMEMVWAIIATTVLWCTTLTRCVCGGHHAGGVTHRCEGQALPRCMGHLTGVCGFTSQVYEG